MCVCAVSHPSFIQRTEFVKNLMIFFFRFFLGDVDRCSFCQTYVERLSTIVNKLESEATIASAGIKVVIIGLGSYSMIVKYRGM